MDLKAHYSEKLSKLFFLNIKKQKLRELFKVDIKEDIYIPVAAEDLADKIKNESSLNKIPMSFFLEGMFYVLGADSNFKYNEYYNTMLLNAKESDKYIKSRIAKEIKKSNYEEAYIMLKGLFYIEKSQDNLSKLLLLCDKLRSENSKLYREEELDLIEKSKKFDENFKEPYFYESLLYRDDKDFQKAFYCINTYISKGGEETKEITEFKDSLKVVNDYDKGKELVNTEPDNALNILMPLLDTIGDNAEIYYYIAVAYRNLKNHQKAIYYLNEALSIDDKAVEIINEMGLNYASIGEFEKAIAYFRSAFQFTGSVEICTNLIMCYLNTKDIKQAKIHLKLAKEINKEDEIVKDLEKLIGEMEA
ncbi:tetratricopeptide repeat protein [Haloimpatiens sp. FM7315]|uniref:tetratricopeptide repeat protein n=1 Tax=Haloimpatiens sp. FM7315 TaxID=3298609 RepID=UPI0035A37C45